MEENVFETKKSHNYQLYFWILVSAIILLVGLAFYDQHTKNENAEIQKIEYQKLLKIQEQHKKDSLIIAIKNKEIYLKQVKFLQIRDSALSSLRYKKGDIVYLKPDSVSGCVLGIESDSMMFSYIYYILVANKSQDPTIYKREDILIF